MENIAIALIVAVVTGTIAPALMLWIKNKNDRIDRREAEAREDAREARAEMYRQRAEANIETIKHQTDGVLTKITQLAKDAGHAEGFKESSLKAQDVASTLELGRQLGRDAERESVSIKGS